MQRIWLWCLLGLSTMGCLAQVDDATGEELGSESSALEKGEPADEELGGEDESLKKRESTGEELDLGDKRAALPAKGKSDDLGLGDERLVLAPAADVGSLKNAAIGGIGWLGNWVSTGDLTDAAPQQRADFGRTVSIDNDRIAVTRRGFPAKTQVFKGNGSGFTLEFSWTAPTGHSGASRIRNNWLVIGDSCYGDGLDPSCSAGQVHIFRCETDGNGTAVWRYVSSLNDPSLPRSFGGNLAFDGTNLAVATMEGVYMYNLQTPNVITHLGTGARPATGYSTSYAYDVAIAGDRVAVSDIGNRQPPGTRYSPGFVHIYDLAGSLLQTITGEGVSTGSESGLPFGFSVAMSGTHLAVSAPQENSRRNRVYLFTRGPSGYTLTSTLAQPWPGGPGFVALDGGRLLVTTGGSALSQALVRFYSVGGIAGPSLDHEIALPSNWNLPAIHGKRAAVGMPTMDSRVGRVATWRFKSPVVQPTFVTQP